MKKLMQDKLAGTDPELQGAIHAALTSAGVGDDELTSLIWKRWDALYEILFSTDWMLYDAFVDPELEKVLGLDYAPADFS